MHDSGSGSIIVDQRHGEGVFACQRSSIVGLAGVVPMQFHFGKESPAAANHSDLNTIFSNHSYSGDTGATPCIMGQSYQPASRGSRCVHGSSESAHFDLDPATSIPRPRLRDLDSETSTPIPQSRDISNNEVSSTGDLDAMQ